MTQEEVGRLSESAFNCCQTFKRTGSGQTRLEEKIKMTLRYSKIQTDNSVL